MASPPLYIPDKKYVIASSFEGIINNDARECGAVSLSVWERMVASGRLKGYASFEGYDSKLVMKEFLFLRPLVAVAEDYLTVLMLIQNYKTTVKNIVRNPWYGPRFMKEVIAHFKDEFERVKFGTLEQRAEFKDGFKSERRSRQVSHYRDWLGLQYPYVESLAQFRKLSPLKKFDPVGGEMTGGFLLYYVTSKDEFSTWGLCNYYGELEFFTKNELTDPNLFRSGENLAEYFNSMKNCLITREHIIGVETVPDADKVKQMTLVAERENIPHKQVIRLQDRYDLWEREIGRASCRERV